VTLDEPLLMAAHPDPRQVPGAYDGLIGGLHTRPALIEHRGRQSGLQLSLTPQEGNLWSFGTYRGAPRRPTSA